ncbi:MAG: hypothetical protein IMZ74_02320 [Actinobacteria bacterium]|nr:hypothetical protein [Actinomycetota bacterium]
MQPPLRGVRAPGHLAGGPDRGAGAHGRALPRQASLLLRRHRRPRQPVPLVPRSARPLLGDPHSLSLPVGHASSAHPWRPASAALRRQCLPPRLRRARAASSVKSVQLCAATHPVDPGDRERDLEYALPIVVGTNVWIAASVVIGPGVTIGDNSTIGAGSVVLNDVPANVAMAGNPSRIVRHL